MTDTAKKFYQGQPGTTDTLLYTAPATGATILSIHATNTAVTAQTFTIGVNCTGALAAANHIISALTLAPSQTYDYLGMIQLDNSATTGTVRALQSSATAISLVISGNEIT